MRKSLSLLAVLVLSSVLVIAQVKVLTGRITDDKGQPVPFATVKVKSSKSGVSADADGNFSIKAKPGDVLVFSGTGVTEKDVPVGESLRLNISLERRNAAMTEVVVTALGQTTSKNKVGYNTQTFNTATINKNGVSGPLDGLQGRVAGADISRTGGPGSSTKVVMRGFGIIAGGNNQPLYVIDGVPLADPNFQSTTDGTDGADFGNGLNNINPNDIESINILDGTAASSLYGGLAKNGAVMITLKKGRAGKLKVEYSGSASFSKVGKLPDYQTEFGQGWGGVSVLSENGSWGPRLDGIKRPWGSIVDNSQLIKPFSFIKNNLRDFYNTGTEYNNNISVSGGTDQNRFYFSYGNVTSDGVVPTKSDYLERNTLSFRTNSNYGAFTINTSVNYSNQRLNTPSTGQGTSSGGGVFQSVLQIPVDIPIKDFRDYKNKFFNVNNYFTPYAENPYFALFENGNQQKLDRIFGAVDMGYKISSDLSAQFRVGGDFTNARTFIWKNVANALPGTWVGKGATNPEGYPRNPDIGEVGQGADYYGIINGDFVLKYNKHLNEDFTLDALAGVNYYQQQQRSELTTVTDLLVPGFFNLNNTTSVPVPTDISINRRRIGAYAQATIGYMDQLFLTGNIREDKSSTLPASKNSIFYPGANASWVASNLFKDSKTVSYLKIRAAYGRTGSDPDPYLVRTQLGSGTIQLPFGTMHVPFNGIGGFGVSNQIGNPNLKPILTDELEVGAEARFLRDAIGLNVTLYDKKTKGQIFGVPIAPSSGYTTFVENLGQVSNKGIEVTLNVRPVQTRDVTWNFTYIFSKNWNRVDNLQGAQQNPLIFSAYDAELRAVVGKTVASIYAPVPQMTPDGKHVVVDEKTGYQTLNSTPLDKFGLTKGFYGNGLYDYTMGFNNTVTYKNLSLNFALDFRYGGVMYSQTADMVMFDGNSVATLYNDRKPFIVPTSVNAVDDGSGHTTYVENKTFVGATGANQSDNTYGYYYPSQNLGGAYKNRIIDRSFLKLRDINLSYSLPAAWYSKLGASSASLGVFGRNFLLWVPKANVFVDPEATNFGNDLNSQLGEFATEPLTKSFGVILKVGF